MSNTSDNNRDTTKLIDTHDDPNFDAVVDVIDLSTRQRHRAETGTRPFLGIDFQPQRRHITFDQGLHVGSQSQVDFVVLPLTRYNNNNDDGDDDGSGGGGGGGCAPLMERVSGGKRPVLRQTDMLLRTSEWNNKVVGAIDERWITALANDGNGASDVSAGSNGGGDVIRQEIEWASHLSLPSVMVPLPSDLEIASRVVAPLARILNQVINTRMHYSAIWVQIPLVLEGNSATMNEKFFELWLRLKALCNYHTHVGVVLRWQQTAAHHKDESMAALADHIFEQWFCEPLKGFIIPFSTFKNNKVGHPVIAHPLHEHMLIKCFKRDLANNVQIILQNDIPPLSLSQQKSSKGKNKGQLTHRYEPYRDFLVYVYNESTFIGDDAIHDSDTPIDNDDLEDQVTHFEKPYLDYLQMPLQPLLDNLESQTYEVFERDPVKYALYEQATMRALDDIITRYHDPQVDDTTAGQNIITLMVVGAGRGPLVKAAMRAIRKSSLSAANERQIAGRQPLKIKIYALEKNPHALVILNHLKHTIWMPEDDLFRQHYPYVIDIEIVSGDMRKSGLGDIRCDVMISELLGSFGDNELSPECLDGARQLLKSKPAFGDDRDGVSIPYSYTSYLAPLSCNKIFTEMRAFNSNSTFGDVERVHLESVKPFETAYVVKVHRGVKIAPPQAIFTFTHTPFESVEQAQSYSSEIQNNDRSAEREFTAQFTAEMHALVGYFECVLYRSPSDPSDVVLMSIHPDTHSKLDGCRMISWFPIVFPIGKAAMMVRKGDTIRLHMWRQSDSSKVWYEWCLTSPHTTSICNVNGRSYVILK